MKKTIIKWVVIVASVIAVICTVQVLRGKWIFPIMVQRVEFRGFSSCSGPVSDKVELSKSEIRELAFHYSTARYMGRCRGEGCDSDFGIKFYLAGGMSVYVREAGSPRLEVRPPFGEKYWINSEELAQYARELVEQYDLMVA
jgi:hypothetical protein